MGKVVPFRKPSKRNPDAAQAIVDYCEKWIDDGTHLELCREMLRIALDLDPKNVTTKSEYGRVLYLLREYLPAAAYHLEAAETVPTSWAHWYNAGVCKYADCRYIEALECFDHAYNLSPETPDVLYYIARTFNQLCQPEKELLAWQLFLKVATDENEKARARHAIEMIMRGRR